MGNCAILAKNFQLTLEVEKLLYEWMAVDLLSHGS